MLNGQPMGGKRRSAYHFDLWSLKYLPKFKWEALTEEIGEPCIAPSCMLHHWPCVCQCYKFRLWIRALKCMVPLRGVLEAWLSIP